MSVRVMSAIWEIPMPPTDKLVMLALADCADEEGRCWPSIATIARKSGVSERSVQRAIRKAEESRLIQREEVIGKGCKYRLHPRHSVTPDNVAPVTGATPTPDTVSPKPSRTTKLPKKDKPSLVRAHELPANWCPDDFGLGTQCRKIVDGWPPGELEHQLEHFEALHRKKGSKWQDWQAAWRTWVLNSVKYGGGNGQRNHQPSGWENAYAANIGHG